MFLDFLKDTNRLLLLFVVIGFLFLLNYVVDFDAFLKLKKNNPQNSNFINSPTTASPTQTTESPTPTVILPTQIPTISTPSVIRSIQRPRESEFDN